MERKRRDWTWPVIVIIVFLMLLNLHAQTATAAPGSSDSGTSDSATAVDAPLPQHVLDRIDRLEREVARLHGEEDQTWLDERRAEEVKALVHEVLSDAQTRASLLSDEALAGYNNGFFIRSPDGQFYLKIRGMIQTRYTFNIRQDEPAGQDGDQGGFEMARTRIGFVGHIIDPTWKFMIWTGYGANGSAILLDAWVKKELPAGFAVTAGQFKVPMWKEWLVSETSQQFIERSLLTAKTSGIYTQGVVGEWQNEMFHFALSFNDGMNATNSAWNADRTHWAVTGRAEWKAFGDWKNYNDFESWQGSDPLLVFGVAANYQQGDTGGSTQNPDNITWTADALWKFGGGNVFAAIVGSHNSGYDSATASYPPDYYGALIQGGYFITPELEAIARYECGFAEDDNIDQLSVASAGFNYFFKKWSARFSFDVGYSFNAMPAFWASSGMGWLPDNSHGQVVIRTQMQLLF